jgi:hypothetical protein
MRRALALTLCTLSNALVIVMALLAGIGLTVALIVLAVAGTISVGGAVLVFFFGLPIVEFVMYWVTMALSLAMLGTAKLLDDHAAEDWAYRQDIAGY